jgi:hypothetical protein
MSDRILTFAEFQATGRNVLELAAIAGAQGFEGPGRVYCAGFVIETGRYAAWCLTIENGSRESNDLASLERDLYDWARGEGYIDEPVSDDERSNGPVRP